MEAFMKVIRKWLSNIARTLLTPPNKLHDQQRMNNSKEPTNPTYKVWYRYPIDTGPIYSVDSDKV
jgi:hypothetical protein